MNSKRKIINDPVFGFIGIPDDLIQTLIKHPYLQRLSRIKQMGLAYMVYPGAQHTRFHHSLGTMYLANETLNHLKSKNHSITPEEFQGVLAATLMHDIGHGPFSHALENALVTGINHEEISLMLMQQMNKEFNGALDTCIAIFRNNYPKKFLHQLVCGQLDMDRLDYLRRDSFFTGVTEGNIGSARIIKILDVCNDNLVIEEKGIYSIENFLTTRRLMYWQVYLHKTAVAAEKMLINTLLRAKKLASEGVELFASPAFHYFLYNKVDKAMFLEDPEALASFVQLDDNDIWCALKVWTNHPDKVLSALSKCLINRNLFKIEIASEPFPQERLEKKISLFASEFSITREEAGYLLSSDEISAKMYNGEDNSINILYKDGTIKDISEASDMLNIELLSQKIKKYYFCYMR